MTNTNDKQAPAKVSIDQTAGDGESDFYLAALNYRGAPVRDATRAYNELVAVCDRYGDARAEEARREGRQYQRKVDEKIIERLRAQLAAAQRRIVELDTEAQAYAQMVATSPVVAAQRTAGGDAVAFTEAWKRHYQYSPSFKFLNDKGKFCTPADDPVHFGWIGWQLAQRTPSASAAVPGASAQSWSSDGGLRCLNCGNGLSAHKDQRTCPPVEEAAAQADGDSIELCCADMEQSARIDGALEMAGVLSAVAKRLRALAAPTAQPKHSAEYVTRESALEALEHVEQHNGPGRKAEAVAMLEAAQPTLPDDELSVEDILRLVCDHTGQRINLSLAELDQHVALVRDACALAALRQKAAMPDGDMLELAKGALAASDARKDDPDAVAAAMQSFFAETPDDERAARLVDDALAKVGELGTVGAMRWLSAALRHPPVPNVGKIAMRNDTFTVIPQNMQAYQMSVRDADIENDLYRTAFDEANTEYGGDDVDAAVADDFFQAGWKAAVRCLGEDSAAPNPVPNVRELTPEWHAPGLGEVHHRDHKFMIDCMREVDDPDQYYVADDALAERVCAALNAAPNPDAEDATRFVAFITSVLESEKRPAKWSVLTSHICNEMMARKPSTIDEVRAAIDAARAAAAKGKS